MTLSDLVGRRARLAGALAAGMALHGCVLPNTPENIAQLEETNDPLEPTNRYIFEVNRFLDEIVLKPLAWWYRIGVPDPARERIHNAILNLRLPWTAANDLLQWELRRTYVASMRFVINSTIGIVGLFDVATGWGFPYHEEDVGQTLAVWGAPEGPYLMLPIFGPSNVRDAVGRIGDYFGDPVNIILDNNSDSGVTARGGASGVDARERNIETIADIERNAVDFYATVRSIYRQRRDADIRNSDSGSTAPLPTLSQHPRPTQQPPSN